MRRWIVVPFVAAVACAQVSAPELPDGGSASSAGVVVDPAAGPIGADAKFTVAFAAAMDVRDLLASDQRSDTVVLVPEAVVERAAAILERGKPSAAERALFLPATATVAAGARSLALSPQALLPAGGLFLLVSPRLRDTAGHRLGAAGRFRYEVAGGPPAVAAAQLVDPPPGWQPPTNLARVRAVASGALSLVDGDGGIVAAPVAADGGVELRLCAPGTPCAALQPGAVYRLAVDGAPQDAASFTAAACDRAQPPAFSPEGVSSLPEDTSVSVHAVLDWPGDLVVEVEPDATAADAGVACAGAACAARVRVECTPPPCGPRTFACPADLSLSGLLPDHSYVLVLHAEDAEGLSSAPVRVPVATRSARPHPMLTEIMASPPPPAPDSAGEYLEILNAGSGMLDVSALAVVGPDGVVRPLLGEPPPLPVLLAPGARALAVGLAFDAAHYPSLPRSVPILRSRTHRLLSHGLPDSPPALQLVALDEPSRSLSSFPGGGLHCPRGTSLQRDETVADDSASWTCGVEGGTPGTGP